MGLASAKLSQLTIAHLSRSSSCPKTSFVTVTEAGRALLTLIQAGSGGGLNGVVEPDDLEPRDWVEGRSPWAVADKSYTDNVKESAQLTRSAGRLNFGCYVAWPL